MKKFLALLLLFTLVLLRGYAQEETPEEAEETSPQKGIENVWRSSDLEGEQAVLRQNRRGKKPDGSEKLPEGSMRVSCICMDYIEQQHIGRGACGGHNGVRFWVYALPNGDTARIPTLRHDGHPDTLLDTEILKLAAFKRYERLTAQRQVDFYKSLEEHPEWLTDITAHQPSASMYPDSVRMIMPNMPLDHTAENSVLYSISVFLGSGALYVLKKLIQSPKPPDDIPELPKPQDLI
jgi:hypothetical protein